MLSTAQTISGIGFQPVMTELTGWKPIPQEFCDSNCLADAKPILFGCEA